MFDNVFTLDTAFVSMAVGVIIAFLLFWAPGLAPLWAKNEVKRLTLIGLFLGVPLAVTALGCYTIIPIRVLVGCSPAVDPAVALTTNIWDALKIGFAGLAASQGGYLALLKWAPDLVHQAHLDQLYKSVGTAVGGKLWLTMEGKAQDGNPAVASVWDPNPVEVPYTVAVGSTSEDAPTG